MSSQQPSGSALLDMLADAINRLKDQPPLLDIEVPALVIGDLHGDLYSLLSAFKIAEEENIASIVFLGDYVDRGPKQLEVLCSLLEKLLNPDGDKKISMLRGNHETPSVNSSYGFLEQLKKSFPDVWEDIYSLFNTFSAHLPYAAIGGGYLLIHGGLARGLKSIDDLAKLEKPLLEPKPNTPEFEILWNDPAEFIEGFIPNTRGHGTFLFGPDITEEFVRQNDLVGIIRSHEPPPTSRGYSIAHKDLLITIFSCRYYGVAPTGALVDQGKYEIIYLGSDIAPDREYVEYSHSGCL